jgi:WXXGXW repeat (2 copies)
MKTKLRVLAVALIAGGAMFAQPRVAIGIGVGGYGPGYYPPPAYQQYVPPCPGPDYAWVGGYWAPQGGRNVWINGFWRAPFVSGYRVAPRYYNSYRGYDRDRGYENRYQNHGRERGNESRGRAYSNSFRR